MPILQFLVMAYENRQAVGGRDWRVFPIFNSVHLNDLKAVGVVGVVVGIVSMYHKYSRID